MTKQTRVHLAEFSHNTKGKPWHEVCKNWYKPHEFVERNKGGWQFERREVRL